jgi:hypothetical protein
MSDERRAIAALLDAWDAANADGDWPGLSEVAKEVENLRAALASSPSDGEPPKPVAWQVVETFDDGAPYNTYVHTEQERAERVEGYLARGMIHGTITPLYVHPPRSAPAAEPDYDALARALREMALDGGERKASALGVLSRMRHTLKQAFRAAPAERETETEAAVRARVRELGKEWPNFDDVDEIASLATIGEPAEPLGPSGFTARTVMDLAHAYRVLRALRAAPSGDRGNG